MLCWLALTLVVLAVGRVLTGPLAGSVGVEENDLARWLAAHRTPGLDTVAEVGTFLGNTLFGVVALALLGAGVAWWRRSWRPLVLVVVVHAALFGDYLLATALDPRDRPPVKILDPGLVPDHSFPSGHTITATILVGCLLVVVRTWTRWPVAPFLALLLVPPLTMLSRMYQGAHHLSDVLTACAAAVTWLVLVDRAVARPVRDLTG